MELLKPSNKNFDEMEGVELFEYVLNSDNYGPEAQPNDQDDQSTDAWEQQKRTLDDDLDEHSVKKKQRIKHDEPSLREYNTKTSTFCTSLDDVLPSLGTGHLSTIRPWIPTCMFALLFERGYRGRASQNKLSTLDAAPHLKQNTHTYT